MAGQQVHLAFERRLVQLPIEALLPTRLVSDAVRSGAKFRRIRASVPATGVIEPIVVAPPRDGGYLLLDGHLRLAVLRDLGVKEVCCLVATDDEAFTYNKRVNHIATIQEHRMIVRALERGVPEEKIAQALDVDVKHVRRRRAMLDGICSEVAHLLGDKRVAPRAFDFIRKMKPLRQIEVAELMLASGNYTASYMEMLLAGTQQRDLVSPEKKKRIGGMTPEQVSRMEREIESVSQEFRSVESTYGETVFELTMARGYVAKLMRNRAVTEFLTRSYPDVAERFRELAENGEPEQSRPMT